MRKALGKALRIFTILFGIYVLTNLLVIPSLYIQHEPKCDGPLVLTFRVIFGARAAPGEPVWWDDFIFNLSAVSVQRAVLEGRRGEFEYFSTTFRGTGFRVSPNRVITANHLIEEEFEYIVENSLGEAYKVGQIFRNTQSDIAVLEVLGPGWGGSPLPLGDPSTLKVGDPVYFVGASKDSSNNISYNLGSGRFLGVDCSFTGQRLFLLSASAQKGFSGGPVLDGEGRVVGVLVKGHFAGTHSGFSPLSLRFDGEAGRWRLSPTSLVLP